MKTGVIGYYGSYGYNIWLMTNGQVMEELYRAGNSPCESTLVVPLAHRHESVRTLRKWCIQTGKELAEEHGLPWLGSQREEQDYP